MATEPVLRTAWNQDFSEILSFFKKKGYALSPKSWRDLWQAAHARAFTVARVTAMDVLEDIRGEVEKAITAGLTLDEFKKNLKPILERKGWLAPKGEAALLELPDGTVRKRLTGHRLITIFRTNASAAYNTGRWKQQYATRKTRPALQYRITPKPNNRADHKAHDGEVYDIEDKFWSYWYPPNDFNCGCYVKSLSLRQMEARGLKMQPKDRKITDMPGEGWEYNPGKAGLDAWQPDFAKYTDEARKLLKETLKG